MKQIKTIDMINVDKNIDDDVNNSGYVGTQNRVLNSTTLRFRLRVMI